MLTKTLKQFVIVTSTCSVFFHSGHVLYFTGKHKSSRKQEVPFLVWVLHTTDMNKQLGIFSEPVQWALAEKSFWDINLGEQAQSAALGQPGAAVTHTLPMWRPNLLSNSLQCQTTQKCQTYLPLRYTCLRLVPPLTLNVQILATNKYKRIQLQGALKPEKHSFAVNLWIIKNWVFTHRREMKYE